MTTAVVAAGIVGATAVLAFPRMPDLLAWAVAIIMASGALPLSATPAPHRPE
jgi:hypothetical protein